MEMLIFLLFAALAVCASLVVVLHRNPVYSTMALVVTLFAVAVLFVMLGAPFLGALQVLIYAGAIVVLFLFVIMLLNVEREELPRTGQRGQRWTALAGAAVFLGLLGLLTAQLALPDPGPLTPEQVSLKGLALDLFAEYLLPFEIAGLLLLVAVVGASVVSRKGPRADTAEVYASGYPPRVDGREAAPDPNRPPVAEAALEETHR
jgi:NADH-quinone oxidoreductase subunit J